MTKENKKNNHDLVRFYLGTLIIVWMLAHHLYVRPISRPLFVIPMLIAGIDMKQFIDAIIGRLKK